MKIFKTKTTYYNNISQRYYLKFLETNIYLVWFEYDQITVRKWSTTEIKGDYLWVLLD